MRGGNGAAAEAVASNSNLDRLVSSASNAHTNTIEGFWSLVKRGIGGVYHSVSAKHLQSYLSEYAWRYNRRHDGSQKFSALLAKAAG